MSYYESFYKNQFGQRGEANAAIADVEGHPILSELLLGVMSKDKRNWELPPHTLTIWLEAGQCKFAIGAGELYPKCFGTFSELAEGIDGVEKALESRKCEWKEPKGRR
jgi:hypothetical protein